MDWDYFSGCGGGGGCGSGGWEAAVMETDWDPATNERHFGSVLEIFFMFSTFWRVLFWRVHRREDRQLKAVVTSTKIFSFLELNPKIMSLKL